MDSMAKLAVLLCIASVSSVVYGSTNCALPHVKEDLNFDKIEGKWYTVGVSYTEGSRCRVDSQFHAQTTTTGTVNIELHNFAGASHKTEILQYEYKKVGKSRFAVKSSKDKEFSPEFVIVSDSKQYIMKLFCDAKTGKKVIEVLVPNPESHPEQVAAATNALEDVGEGWELVKLYPTDCKKIPYSKNSCELPEVSEQYISDQLKGRWYMVGQSSQLKGCTAIRGVSPGKVDSDYFNINDETQNTLTHYDLKKVGPSRFLKTSHLGNVVEVVLFSDYENYLLQLICDHHSGEKVVDIFSPNPESFPEQVAAATNRLEEIGHGWELMKLYPTECKNLPNVHYDIHDVVVESENHGHSKCTLPDVTKGFQFEKLLGTWYSAGESHEISGCTAYKDIEGTSGGGKVAIEHTKFGDEHSHSEDHKEYKKVGNSRFTEKQGGNFFAFLHSFPSILTYFFPTLYQDDRESSDFVMVSDYKNYAMKLSCCGHTGKRVVTVFVPSPESQPEQVAAATNELEEIGGGWELLKLYPTDCKRLSASYQNPGHAKIEL
uniref:uncharacterized protein LOC120329013 isoform X1 n=1 Tax=Styela clava TaxID=7725 RepID=UPI00193A0CF1|nr:uncharacterized protein LOC120329013 isoform X1 [Styela clava]